MPLRAAFHNLGCKVNAYEVEAMQQMMTEAGYELVPFTETADVYVINTCTVTNIADRKSRQMLHRAKKRNPGAVVVAVGCYAEIRGEELEKDPAIDLVIGTNRKSELVQLLDAHRQEKRAEFLPEEKRKTGPEKEEKTEFRGTGKTLDLSGKYRAGTSVYEELQISGTTEHTRAFIKVQDGCDRFCSYCIIPYARGRVRSRRPEEVCREVERLTAAGVKEIVLTGIHICSYGKDLEDNIELIDLIRTVHEMEGVKRLRLGSLEPSYITEKTAEAMAELPGLCAHFHLSLQSGCDATLQRMNRHYTTEEFAAKAALLRQYFDDPALTTDIITGFPGETEEEFAATVQFVENMQFFETHVFPYSRREGTRAAGMPGQLTEKVKKERSSVLLRLNARNQEQFLLRSVGQPVEVLFEEKVCVAGEEYWAGYGRKYQRILMKSGEDLTNSVQIVRPYGVQNGVLLA